MKIKITVHVHYNKFPWQDKGEYEVFSFKAPDDDARSTQLLWWRWQRV